MRLFGERPFRPFDYGPDAPAAMSILLSLCAAVVYAQLWLRLVRSGANAQLVAMLVLLPSGWWTYFRLQKLLTADKRAMTLLWALVLSGYLMLGFCLVLRAG